MSIIYNEKQRLFSLETADSEYQMKVNTYGILLHLYYGKKVNRFDMGFQLSVADRGFSGNPYEARMDRGISLDTLPQEYTGANVGDMRIGSLCLEQENGSRSCDLRYDGHRIYHGKYQPDGLPGVRTYLEDMDSTAVMTLEIDLSDGLSGIRATLCYGVFEKENIITRAVKITNTGKNQVILHKASSLCMDFPYGDYDLIHFHGRHCMERQFERKSIGHEVITVGSRRGMSSHHHNPFVILADVGTTETQGDAYGFMLAYSGNHKVEVERDSVDSTRIVMGLHDENFSWSLEPGASFWTPEGILSYSSEGLNALSQSYHQVIQNRIIHPKYRDRKRMVLINNWEATYFDFNTEKILQLADAASDLGMDLLVLDDGWFGQRVDDHAGLGDWYVNEEKLPGGLSYLASEVNRRGLQFGLWFEPEMINEQSDLYRTHPDWVLCDPNRKPMLSRDQMVLDMSREDVVNYLFTSMSRVLSGANIAYVKWDCNRVLANVFSNLLPAKQQGEVAHRYMLGVYGLLQRLLDAFPNLMIEGCSGGGGRFDAGMLYFCPQIWTSDNTDPIARASIQMGTSYGYPVRTMGAHVSASPNHQTKRKTSWATRGVVALAGTFGYELDLSCLDDEEKDTVRRQIQDFHKYDDIIANGRYYRLVEGDSNKKYRAWEFVSHDANEALVQIVMSDVESNMRFPCVKLFGLDSDALYREEISGDTYSGTALMQGGYVFRSLLMDGKIYQDEYPAMQLHFVRTE